MRCAIVCLLVGQALSLGTLDKIQVQRSIDFEEAQIKALEAELAASESLPKPFLSQRKAEEALEPAQDASSLPKKEHKEGTTLLISVNENDIDQIPLRLPKLIKAQNHKFSGGQWLVYDNNGVKPSQQMREVMEKSMADMHIDGWMEVDYSQEGMASLYQKVGMRFAPNTPEGNLAHFWMMDQCETEYCAHYDLSVVAFAEDGYSWVDRGINVMQNNEDVMQVVSSTPSKKQVTEFMSTADKSSLLQTTASFTASTCEKVMDEAHTYQGKRFITGRMYLMNKARYGKLFPIAGASCKRSDLRWEEVASCESCRLSLKRATLDEAQRGWHLDFRAEASPALERAMSLVERGVAVTSRLIPHRAAALELWEMEDDFEALHPSF